jgi:hypothetical protein
MTRVTKKHLQSFLKYKKNGEIYSSDLEALQAFKHIEAGKNRYHYWSGTRNNMKLIELFNMYLLNQFCKITLGNDCKGGKDSDFFFIEKSELAKLQKRVSYFITNK